MDIKKKIIIILISAPVLFIGCGKTEKKTRRNSDAIPVTTVTAKLSSVNVQYKSTGNLAPREAPVITTRIDGQITEIPIHEGEEVKKGQLLLKIEEEHMALSLKQAQARLLQAQALVNETQKSKARADKLIGKGYVSQESYDEAQAKYESAQANLAVANADLLNAQFLANQTSIISPINGQVGKLLVSVGEYVPAGTKLMNVVNHDQLRAELPFSEQKTDLLAKGQKVTLTSPTDPNEVLTSTVTSITPDINPENRAVNALIVFNNKYNWKPGSSIRGVVYAKTFRAFLVPEESIIDNDGQTMVYVVKNNKAIAQNVEVSYQIDGSAAITKGLAPNDQIVTMGMNYLSNGTPVTIKATNGPKK
ncbi:Membrane-fusion protein (plasmid) [Legionella adelaidensis]|uniref:Membrane-fusion protein n=1 Tax=Legionella adelaidensis TaxID=45056 RepID=A0A0W0R1X8_9GAMM|nr:efflux RND transporter periplasmic adaptor subunit [Legionella adelaidensis]KTC65061.1 membrane fusion protein [Legionella adelaidensis]VEH85419.1 Membrane-fusion protein [Legionella adelaidensis]